MSDSGMICLVDHQGYPCACGMKNIERGRTFDHRNGQLESDIFDRDLKIKDLESRLSEANKRVVHLENALKNIADGYNCCDASINAKDALTKSEGV